MKIYLILWLSILFPGELKHSLCVFWNVYLSIGIFIYNLGYYFFLVGLFTVVINSFVALCLILCHQLDSKPLEGRYYAYHVQCWFLVPCIMPGTEYVLKLLINRKTYLEYLLEENVQSIIFLWWWFYCCFLWFRIVARLGSDHHKVIHSKQN